MSEEIEKFQLEGGEFTGRSRRLRGNRVLREMVRETRITESCLLYPMFVTEGKGVREEIQAMPGQYRYSVDEFLKELQKVADSGVPGILLFGIPDHKDACGSGAWVEDGIIQKALRAAKREFPELYYVTDVCMCEYTSHGHCGILSGHDVDNDRTLTVLAKTALSHAQAGADMVAPSDMMDFRVAAIRQTLDRNGYAGTPIMAYSAKYASAYYGPFREAAGSAPAFGDRRTYQMDYHNRKEALKEVLQDVREGADIVMVKPAMSYLDILREITDAVDVPTAVYSVSGEYAMIKAAAAAGYIDEAAIVCESAVGMRRAGASILITYFAKELAGYIREGRIG